MFSTKIIPLYVALYRYLLNKKQKHPGNFNMRDSKTEMRKMRLLTLVLSLAATRPYCSFPRNGGGGEEEKLAEGQRG